LQAEGTEVAGHGLASGSVAVYRYQGVGEKNLRRAKKTEWPWGGWRGVAVSGGEGPRARSDRRKVIFSILTAGAQGGVLRSRVAPVAYV